jgi:phage/plasmid-associated DNA primase
LLENFRFQFSGFRSGEPQLIGEVLPVPVIACKSLYEDYVEWCLENGYRPLNSCNFGKEVKRSFPGVKKEQIREAGKRVTKYSGLYKCL